MMLVLIVVKPCLIDSNQTDRQAVYTVAQFLEDG